jgi:hypothetical protein
VMKGLSSGEKGFRISAHSRGRFGTTEQVKSRLGSFPTGPIDVKLF